MDDIPSTALAAEITNYGGDPNSPFNGVLVELGLYLDDVGFFEAGVTRKVVDGGVKYRPGDTVLCRADELKPLNSLAEDFIRSYTEPDAEDYEDAVYALRDLLDKAGVHATAASISHWNSAQRTRVEVWARFILENKDTFPPKPKELL